MLSFQSNGADAIEIAKLKNKLWQCVVRKDEYKVNDWALYFEIDSLIPIEEEIRSETPFEFLRPRAKEYDGKLQYRLKTMKLRGALSQGLLMPISIIGLDADSVSDQKDYAENVGVTKYDPPEYSGGNIRSSGSGGRLFPSFIPKTDQERIQNIVKQYNAVLEHYDAVEHRIEDMETFEVTYKLDGSSITVYANNNHLGICSRNFELKLPLDWSEWPDIDNHFIQAALKEGLLFHVAYIHSTTGRNLAFQGELCGPGIQNNFEGLKEHKIFIYDIYDINSGTYMLPKERRNLLDNYNIAQVPMFTDKGLLHPSIDKTLEMADGPSGLSGKYREGLVYKSNIRDFSFKAIGNQYLLLKK